MAGATPNTRVTPTSDTAGVSVAGSIAGRPARTLLVPGEATRRTGYRSRFANDVAVGSSTCPICGTDLGDGRLGTPSSGDAWHRETGTRPRPFSPAPARRAGRAPLADDGMPLRRSPGQHRAGPEDRELVPPDVLHRHRGGGHGVPADHLVHRPVQAAERRAPPPAQIPRAARDHLP